MRDFLAFLSGFAVLAVVWGLLLLLKRASRRGARSRTARVDQIDAEYGRDYRGPGRKGEPFFRAGGVGVLVGVAVSWLLSIWLSGWVRPFVDWVFPRSPH